MFLSRPDLIKEVKSGSLRFDPLIDLKAIHQVSIDLRLGREFTSFKRELPPHIAAVYLDQSLWEAEDIWERRELNEYKLEPNHFVLAQTLEKVTIPRHLVGLIEGRSRYARLGLTTHLTAPKIDPGFCATITLEIANLGSLPIMLRAGTDVLAQLMLVKLSKKLTKKEAYGGDEGDIFQGQVTSIPSKKKPPPTSAKENRRRS